MHWTVTFINTIAYQLINTSKSHYLMSLLINLIPQTLIQHRFSNRFTPMLRKTQKNTINLHSVVDVVDDLKELTQFLVTIVLNFP